MDFKFIFNSIDNGEIFSFGKNEYGECGIETNEEIKEIMKIKYINKTKIYPFMNKNYKMKGKKIKI